MLEVRNLQNWVEMDPLWPSKREHKKFQGNKKEIQPPHPSWDLYPSANNYPQPPKLQMQQGLTIKYILEQNGEYQTPLVSR